MHLRSTVLAALLATAALLAGCASVDFDAPKPASSHTDIDTRDTAFGRNLGPLREARAPESGFFPLYYGIDALSARLLLIDRAEKTLDVQYYLVGNDPIGDLFFEKLLAAADRGVRVRLLIDDIGTRTIEGKLAPVDSHPNVELRLFNPFASRDRRAFDAWDLKRLNRRMHNKSLTADGEVTIMGGRNIAGEYFAANPDYNFGDIDVAAVGQVARDTGVMFDRYWNDRYAVPYAQLSPARPGAGEREALRERLRASIATLADTGYGDVVARRYQVLSYESPEEFTWARYALVYDRPDMALSDDTTADDMITTSLKQVAGRAQEELLVISPYFVPRKAGIQAISKLAQRGVQVDVLTNGLASNDHLFVYGGYAPSRKPLLREGVRFFEARGNLAMRGRTESGLTDADSKLHGKAFVVDREYAFIGSFNWDPRSAVLNTEMGVVIASEEIAGNLAGSIYDMVKTNAYQVSLGSDGDLRWETAINGERRIYDKEPESTAWGRFKANLMRFLPIRGQL